MSDNISPKIIFFGTPDFAVASLRALIEHEFNVIAVVTAPDKPAGRGRKLNSSAVKEYALSQNLKILQPEKLKDPEFLKEIKSLNPDLQIVVAFRMLPESVWNLPPMGTINVHASLLPQYRGAAPINWAIINGEKQTGVTTFKLRHEIDTGPLLAQKKIDILPEDNMGSLYEKLMSEGALLLVDTIQGLVENKIIPQNQQLSIPIKHAPKIFKQDCQINWNQPGQKIHDFIRGLSPYPAAFTFLEGKQLKVFASIWEEETHQKKPGEMESDGQNFLRFAAKNGWVKLLDVQYEGKKRMKIEDFLRGFRFS